VLSEAQDGPAEVAERRVVLAIALDIAPELLLPEGTIRGGQGRVLGALVPEAAIDEDGDLLAGERDVRAGCGPPVSNAMIYAESEPSAMEE
jgi:hypothetical protein